MECPCAPSPLVRSTSTSSDMGEECITAGCARRSWNLKGGEVCCGECGRSNGSSHGPDCDSLEECVQKAARWREALRESVAKKLTDRFVLKGTSSEHSEDIEAKMDGIVARDEALVNTSALEEALHACVDSKCWTKERLAELFRIMSVKQDGKVIFSELMTWTFCCYPKKDLTMFPVGSAPQNIGVRITARTSGTDLVKTISANVPGGFLLNVSKSAAWGEIAELLGLWLGLPSESLIFTSCDDLKDYTDLGQSLENSSILLPGPAARRGGKKLELFFDVQPSVATTAPLALVQYLDADIRLKCDAIKEEMRGHRQALATEALEEAERFKRENVDKELDEFVCKRICISKLQFEELSADEREKEVNYLVEETSEEAKRIISELIGRPVIRLYRNENHVMKRRYEAAKERLQKCGRAVTMETTNTQKCISGEPPLDNLGPYDPGINEFPMWHGTGREGVSGILKSNFDIRRCGKHGLAYGTGFYFADDPRTSCGYASMEGCDHVNSKYPQVAYMLLNRVMCGNIKHFERQAMSHEEFDRWTADCIGSGGVWAGKDARFECIKSPGTFCWVAVHPDQIYPAYLILYKPGSY